jgi:hypothetical protein
MLIEGKPAISRLSNFGLLSDVRRDVTADRAKKEISISDSPDNDLRTTGSDDGRLGKSGAP